MPEYTAPNLDFNTEPEPLMKEVICQAEIIGNWVVIQQTRENEVLQLSEIKFLHGISEKDSVFLLKQNLRLEYNSIN